MPSIAKARQEFTDLLGRAHYAGERIEITRRNTPYAAIVSEEDRKRLEKIDNALQGLGLASVDELLERVQEMRGDVG